ncbi:MAG: hypothetical protein U1E76_11170 [Planctomycetota bacterium]
MLALEVQQSSDTTYRIFDWNRMPKRPLHIGQARAVASAQQVASPGWPRARARGSCEHADLVRCDAFAMERSVLRAQPLELHSHAEFFECWILLDGDASIAVAHGSHRLAPGRAVIVPATLGRFTLTTGHRAELVRITPSYVQPDSRPTSVAAEPDDA